MYDPGTWTTGSALPEGVVGRLKWRRVKVRKMGQQ